MIDVSVVAAACLIRGALDCVIIPQYIIKDRGVYKGFITYNEELTQQFGKILGISGYRIAEEDFRNIWEMKDLDMEIDYYWPQDPLEDEYPSCEMGRYEIYLNGVEVDRWR